MCQLARDGLAPVHRPGAEQVLPRPMQSAPTGHEVTPAEASHTTGGRPSKVILTTVRQWIGCRAGRADHASR
jgi:hypothetical protein